ncbi:sugar phosphate isomerase/epimerase [Paracoccus sp. M683]|uniref:sugar phosphate isomerase/epimerase family protein n=1 Tax=Paracoccus sp. M683 TaxID=2594268 RepID=UPI00118005E6|nr:sugar phosphate isomerase/epimerase [Paracoccus sp. M683]TRW96502.1 sugar phosphate isomerase/epimerase [Paracoccus sp. M683]
MPHHLSVAHLSAITLPPPDFIETASVAGFDGVGLRLLRVTDDSPGYPLMDDPAALRRTQAAQQATGLVVSDIEFVRITADLNPATLEPLLDAGAALRARRLICAPYDSDLSRLAATLAAITELSRARGIQPVLEFFPWTDVPDLATCWNVVQQAGAEPGILVDSLHFDRSNWDLALLRAIPAKRLPFAHICDAPRQPPYTTEALLHAARAERLAPGDGQIDLPAFLRALPTNIDLSVEAPMTALLARAGGGAVLHQLYQRMATFLDRTSA